MSKVHLKTSLLIPGLHAEEFALTPMVATVRAVMQDVGGRMNVRLFKDNGDLIDFLDVRLNGTKVDFFPAGADTTLQDGDQLYLGLVPIGGG
jgi:hypothetical protein